MQHNPFISLSNGVKWGSSYFSDYISGLLKPVHPNYPTIISRNSIPSCYPHYQNIFCLKKASQLPYLLWLIRRDACDNHYYWALNNITVKYCYPLPLIPVTLEQLCGGTDFTKLDLWRVYNLIWIWKWNECKTTFVTPMRHYMDRIMPNGLVNFHSVFQGFINEVFWEYLHHFVLIYTDDIFVQLTSNCSSRPKIHLPLMIHIVPHILHKCWGHRDGWGEGGTCDSTPCKQDIGKSLFFLPGFSTQVPIFQGPETSKLMPWPHFMLLKKLLMILNPYLLPK